VEVNVYKVYKHPSLGSEAVKVGFSWPAAFLNVLWMFAKKLWTLAGLWVLAYIVLAILQDAAAKAHSIGGTLVILAGNLVLGLVPAFKGNEWRIRNLTGRGYEYVDSVQAATPDAAVAQVLKKSPGA